jgi:hypothetical protein
MYTRRYILLVFIKVAIETRYIYKNLETRRKQTEKLLQTAFTATIKHSHHSLSPEKKSTQLLVYTLALKKPLAKRCYRAALTTNLVWLDLAR